MPPLQYPEKITALQSQLKNHRIFGLLQTPQDLALFMSWHVFAVWDFMSLVKSLQQQLSSIKSPWLPPSNPLACRLINDIVLAEESDELPDGSYLSHFEMYLMAMQEIGADTTQITTFIQHLTNTGDVEQALTAAGVSKGIRRFVTHTLSDVSNGNLNHILGNFFYGREDVIPHMFTSLLDKWQLDETQAPMFVYYLKRHIELDSDSHGPAALKIIKEITQNQEHGLEQVYLAAERAIQARRLLWDSLAHEIEIHATQKLSKAS